ncbi:protein kinase [Candidatus Woesearchaeota archaeon]|nr:protein kinase [Candidatus Woesearchaeota archaeon]
MGKKKRKQEESMNKEVESKLETQILGMFSDISDVQLVDTVVKTKPLKADNVGKEVSAIKKLILHGTDECTDEKGRLCRRVRTAEKGWDILIPFNRRTKKYDLLGKPGAQGAAFGAKFEFNIVNSRQVLENMIAQDTLDEARLPGSAWRAIKEGAKEKDLEKLEDEHEDLRRDVSKILDEKGSASEQVEKIEEDWRVIGRVTERVGYLFPDGECALKLYYATGEWSHLPNRESKIQCLRDKDGYLSMVLAMGKIAAKGKLGKNMYWEIAHKIKNVLPREKVLALDFKTQVDLVQKVLKGLKPFHARRLVHRDIKLQNILIDEELNPHVIDYGILQSVDYADETEKTAGAWPFGSLVSAAPEQIQIREGKKKRIQVTCKADMYALGAVLYEMILGVSPNIIVGGGDPLAVQLNLDTGYTKPLMLSETQKLHEVLDEAGLAKESAQEIDLVLAMMLHRDPEKRYATGEECMEDLSAIKYGHKPRNAYKNLKKHRKKKQHFIEDVFSYNLGENLTEPERYVDWDNSKIKQTRAEERIAFERAKIMYNQSKRKLGFFRRQSKPVKALIISAAALLAATIAGGAAYCIKNPEKVYSVFNSGK